MYSRYDDEDSRESGLSIYNPDAVQQMGNGSKKELLSGIEDTVSFLKDVGGYTDKGIDRMKVSEVASVKEKVTKNMTVGNFKKWVEKGTKPEPVVMKIGGFVKDLISWPFTTVRKSIRGGVNETTLSFIFGTLTILMVGVLVARMAGMIQ